MNMNKEKGIGYCGLVCALCKEHIDCVGCKKGGCPEKEQCKNYICCINKGYANCSDCEQFPCHDSILSKLRVRTFCSFVKLYGEDKLLECLSVKENQGVQYHKDGTHYGDYDNFENEQEIIDFILDKNL